MKIGIVTTWFERGAAYVSRQFMELLQKTDTVFIYARGGESYAKGDPRWDLPNVFWGKRNKAKSALYGGTYIDRNDFHRWVKEHQLDLIIFNEQGWFTPLLWCKDWNIKTAAYIDYYTEETIPLFNIYDCLICNTKRHLFAFRNNPNARYLKWGTDINLYKPYQGEHDVLTFFTSAGMAPIRKGTDYVVTAFYNLKERKQSKLLIHTQVPLKETIPDVWDKIEELLSEGTLEIIEKTIPAPGLYSDADVYVYPSRLDGIGLTLMEAASSGLACITIDNAPMNEFIDESFGRVCDVDFYYSRKDGYYWPLSATKVDSLTSTMRKFLLGEEKITDMKKNAREYAERELDFSKNIAPLHEILEKTMYHTDSSAYRQIEDYEKKGVKKIARFLLPFASIYYFFR